MTVKKATPVNEGRSFRKYYFMKRPTIGFPLLLIFIGGYYLLKSFGYIAEDFPFWPMMFFLLGCYLLIKTVIESVLAKM